MNKYYQDDKTSVLFHSDTASNRYRLEFKKNFSKNRIW